MNTKRRLEITALILSGLALIATSAQAFYSHVQIQDLKDEFVESGPVLQIKSELQFQFDDNRLAPKDVGDADRPVVTSRDFDTYDELWLKLMVDNVGRMDTSITDVDVRIAPDLSIVALNNQSATVFCESGVGQSPVDCDKVLPMKLSPGSSVVLYFPLKEYRSQFAAPYIGVGLPVQLHATGLVNPIVNFTSGVSVSP